MTQSAIAVILDSPPLVVTIAKEQAAFDAEGVHYEDVGLGYHNGFYDFLRSRSGTIIGLRYLPDPDAENLLKNVFESENLRFAQDGQLRVLLIFWGQDQDFDPATSSDQYFGDNVIYQAKGSGKLAIGFAIDPLSPLERASFLDFARSKPA